MMIHEIIFKMGLVLMEYIDLIRDEVGMTIKNAAHDYYLSYVKNDMNTFKVSSEIIGQATALFINANPKLVDYINYCKVTASNEILQLVCKRDYTLKEPTIVELKDIEAAASTSNIRMEWDDMWDIIIPLCKKYYNSYLNNDSDTFHITVKMLEALSRIAADSYPDINNYINYSMIEVLNKILNDDMPREYILFNHPLLIVKTVIDESYVLRKDDADMDNDDISSVNIILLADKIKDILDDESVELSAADTEYIVYQLLKDKEELSNTNKPLKEVIKAIMKGREL